MVSTVPFGIRDWLRTVTELWIFVICAPEGPNSGGTGWETFAGLPERPVPGFVHAVLSQGMPTQEMAQ